MDGGGVPAEACRRLLCDAGVVPVLEDNAYTSFDATSAGPGLLALLARAGELPDFPRLEAYLVDTQAKVRRIFEKIVGTAAE